MMLCKNPSPRPAELPKEIQELMGAAQTGAREAAVRDLTMLLITGDRRTVMAAKMALKKLTEDDSRRVSEAAKAALAAAPIAQSTPIVELKTGPAVMTSSAPTTAQAVRAEAAQTWTPMPPPPAPAVPPSGPWAPPAPSPPFGPAIPAHLQPPAPTGAGAGWPQAAPASPPIEKWVLVVLAIVLPPLGIYLKDRQLGGHFWVNIGLMVVMILSVGTLAILPLAHALWFVLAWKPPARS